MNSPIRYFGGKGGQYKTIISKLPDEELWDKYLEPFGGSGVVLLNKKECDIEIYNDLEHNLFSLYWVLNDNKLFNKFKDKCDLTYYHEGIKNHLNSIEPDNVLDRAYKFFMLNRMSYNGVGGFTASSNYVRKNMSKNVRDFLASIEKLDSFHQRWSKVAVYNRDALELIKKYDDKGFLFYLDPPYVKSTRKSNQGYVVDQDDDFHIKMIDVLSNIKNAYVCLSGYDNEIYNELNWNKFSYKSPLSNSIENLWMNY